MRKTPFRPSKEITQTYNSGTVNIYTVTDGAKPGYQAKKKRSAAPKYTLHFEERGLGIKRIYMSRQAQAEIVKVIRVPRVDISPQDVAIIHDGTVYEISTVQAALGVYPPSVDLSLKHLSQNLEVMPK